MNLSIKNFKKLSVKQIKTYAALVMLSAFTIEATALETELAANPEPLMEATIESVFEAELALESWMLSSFEAEFETELALENWMLSPFEALPEMELALEGRMAEPFQQSVSEEIIIEDNICSPAP